MLIWKKLTRRNSLAAKSLARILLISSIVTLFVICAQVYSDYNADISAIDERLRNIERSYLTAIGEQVWNYDIDTLNGLLEGIAQLPDISSVKFVAEDGAEYSKQNTGGVRYPKAKTFKINYEVEGKINSLGELTVVVDLQRVYQRLIDRSVFILVSQFFKTFLVSTFILIIIYYLIVLRINKVIHFASSFSLNDMNDIDMKDFHAENIKGDDELSELFRTIAKMKKQLEEEVKQKEENQQKLFQQANFDSLTKLVNRKCALDRLELLLAQSKRYSNSLGVIYLDIDHFKDINDSLGHDAGDSLLIEAADRIRNTIRQEDIACRLGDDEFLLVLTSLKTPNAIEVVIEKLKMSFVKSIDISGNPIYVTLSIGISIYPTDGNTVQELIKNADAALYTAKAAGRNCHKYFEPKMNSWAKQRLEISSRLRKAISDNEFTIHYQPLLCMKTNKVVGGEALIRWFNKEEGITPPDRFIPLSEENGLIVRIGDQVTEMVFATVVRWSLYWEEGFRIALNISARELQEADFVDRLTQQIKKYSVKKSAIEIEVTERLLLDNRSQSVDNLLKLSSLGIRLSLDDFGTGYSSLSYLQKYPFSTLKLDRSFLRLVPHNKKSAALSSSIIQLAHSLGFEVIAEGVETQEQYEFLKAEGCDIAQGYFIAKPMSVEEFEIWMDQSGGYVHIEPDEKKPKKRANS
ncbi:bifunctional diguanylate cyclase/phosphodiesterase [Spartinivicinus poritis]|uniref:EAL domain-containing protein n=1 Tax=Spartinivicinus poritis TaxID=2994640 RepID=A0ABT5U620_9GAMM|nr:EAL domain-containing protein [Spartinivicinus sp. A2-2]MDE1461809.1 EAL domain-containing protein [Spartinivicinus sp. A2-2]